MVLRQKIQNYPFKFFYFLFCFIFGFKTGSRSMLRKEVIDTSKQQFTNMIDKLNLNDAFENRGYRDCKSQYHLKRRDCVKQED